MYYIAIIQHSTGIIIKWIFEMKDKTDRCEASGIEWDRNKLVKLNDNK